MQETKRSKSRTWLAGAVIAGCVTGALSIASSPVAYAQGAVSDKPISLNFQNAPVTTVLKALFASVGANYSTDPGVQGSVNISLNNVPFSAALHSLLRSANPPLTYDLTDGVYHIKVKQTVAVNTTTTTSDRGGGTTTTSDSSSTSTSTDNKRWYKLPVDHSDVALILPYLSITKGVFIVPSDRYADSGNGNNGNGGGGFGNNGGGFGGGGFGNNGGGFGGGGFGGNNSFGGGGFGGGSSFGGGGFSGGGGGFGYR